MEKQKDYLVSKHFSICMVLLVSIALIVFGYVVIKAGTGANVQKRAFTELQSAAANDALLVSIELDDEFSDLCFLKEHYMNSGKLDDVNDADAVEALMKTNEWDILGYADINGNVYSYDGRRIDNNSTNKYLKDVIAGKENQTIGYIAGEYVLSVSTDSGGIIFAGRKNLIEDIFKKRVKDAGAQSLIAIDAEGTVIADNDEAEESGRSDGLDKTVALGKPDGSSSTILEEIKNGNEGQFSYSSDSNTDYGAFVPISGSSWYLFCIMEKSESEKKYASNLKSVKEMIGLLSMAFCILFLILLNYVRLYVKAARRHIVDLDEKTKAQDRLIGAFKEEFEAVYSVNLKTGKYEILFKDGNLKNFTIPEYGDNVLEAFKESFEEYISKDDFSYLSKRHQQNNLIDLIGQKDKIIFNCKLYIDGEPIYYQLRTTKGTDDIVYIGLRNIDSAMRRDVEQMNRIKTLTDREKVYHDAIMSNSVGYFKANISTGYMEGDILDCREPGNPRTVVIEGLGDPVKFNDFFKWWAENMVTSDKEMFLSLNNTSYLLERFNSGHMAVTVPVKSRFFDDESHEWNQNFYMSKDAETGDVIAFGVLYDAERQLQLQRQIYSLNEDLQEERIKSSLGQMQPHFLYNALSSIREIILDDPEYASDIVYDFSTYLRACIKSITSKKLISFKQELENIQAYINIEKMRFGDRLIIEYDIKADDFQIVPLSIQPLVENAVKHGLYSKRSRKGKVTIKTERINEGVAIHIIDDGVGFDYSSIMADVSEGKSESTGLVNTIFRLKKILGADVDVDSGEMGTHITIVIPDVEERENDEDNSSR